MSYLRDVHKPCPLLWEETVSSVDYAIVMLAGQLAISLVHLSSLIPSACLAPRPMTMVFDLGTRLYSMCMRVKLENGVLLNGQHSGGAVNNFIDLGKFAVIKMLSGRRAQHCDKHHFRAKVSTQTVFKISC